MNCFNKALLFLDIVREVHDYQLIEQFGDISLTVWMIKIYDHTKGVKYRKHYHRHASLMTHEKYHKG